MVDANACNVPTHDGNVGVRLYIGTINIIIFFAKSYFSCIQYNTVDILIDFSVNPRIIQIVKKKCFSVFTGLLQKVEPDA